MNPLIGHNPILRPQHQWRRSRFWFCLGASVIATIVGAIAQALTCQFAPPIHASDLSSTTPSIPAGLKPPKPAEPDAAIAQSLPVIPPTTPDPTLPVPLPAAPETPTLERPLIPNPTDPNPLPSQVCIQRIEVIGSTVFTMDELMTVVQTEIDPITSAPCPEAQPGFLITFEQLIEARTALTNFYVDQGYVTSGALIPEQNVTDGIVTLQILEGQLEAIEVNGTRKLKVSYIRDRLAIAGATPLNTEQLLAGLQLLQQDPLIASINAELAAGLDPSSSILNVQVTENDPWDANLAVDNGRSANVGTLRGQPTVSHNNVSGRGDRFTLTVSGTDGSDTTDIVYSVPVNPRNGRLTLSYSDSDSRVIKEPFDVLNIESDSNTYEVEFRQPLHQTPTEEFALGLTFSRQVSSVTLNPLNTGELPFPTRGSDRDGNTQLSVIRFSQDWLQRSEQEVLAARSQFNLGTTLFGTTQNEQAPDGQFLSWQGQGQWVRRLARDTLLVVRGNVQWSDRPLPSAEQLGIGGVGTVRGYPQSLLTADGGALASAEVRFPLLRVPDREGLLQFAPFIDFGVGWNVDAANPTPNALTAVGLGLLWQDGHGWSARLDWGIPLTDFTQTGNSAQENGLHFWVNWSPF